VRDIASKEASKALEDAKSFRREGEDLLPWQLGLERESYLHGEEVESVSAVFTRND
jgi:hypothetical protein